MNRTIESVLRFVNLTTSGLLAGSLGFGEAALVPGWKDERPRVAPPLEPLRTSDYFNAIGPVALGTAVTLAIAAPRSSALRRVLDSASALSLAGVLAATVMVTVPINQELETQAPTDYPSDRSAELARNWSVAQEVRRALGIGAFVCAVIAAGLKKK